MKYRINWSNIEGGHKGFERLAVQYVQCNYDSRFEHTGDTRDGNKDARLVKNEYTIVVGFQKAENFAEEWWMEAKYSETKERITRYRLDATLVSAILKGIVGRIIFVTNINVDTQTVNDIRQAITCSTCCKEVDFCTRDCLEYWLYQNPDILKAFFHDYHGERIELPNLMLIEQMDFFSPDKSNLVFCESLSVLDIGCTYTARFSVYAHDPQELRIQAESHLRGIEILHPRKWKLDAGVNQLEIRFKLSSNYGYKSAKRKEEHSQLPAPAFKLGTLNIVARRNITVSTTVRRNFDIPSQDSLLRKLQQCFASSQKDARIQLFYISGQSGVGKSHVLDAFIESVDKPNTLIFACEMSENQISNLNNLVRCIDFIYFPFLPADSVRKDYLDCINSEQFFSPLYYNITCCNRAAEPLGRLLSRYISEDLRLFPRRLYVNLRLIIIDDLHKANELVVNTIYKMAMELSTIRAPYMLILSGQQIRHTRCYSELLKVIPVLETELCITATDCLALLPEGKINADIGHFFESNNSFSNMMEMLFFTEFILDHGSNVKDFSSFVALYHLFFHERIMDAYIGRLFLNATREDPVADDLCNKIYWNSVGIKSTDLPEEQKLLSHHVVKLDSISGRLIPYHDIYKNFYRRNYSHRGTLEIPFIELLESTGSDVKKEAIEKLHQAFNAHQFIVVYYSLEPIYRDGASSIFRNLINETEYYTLFYEYALSCTYCSLDHSGKQMFKRIYTEINTLLHPSNQIRKICNAALWELTNSTFESLDYNGAKAYAEELITNTSELIARHIIEGKLSGCIRYHNANVIRSMIKSELQEDDSDAYFDNVGKEMLQNGFQSRFWSYRVRYSLTLMQRAPEKAIRILSACCDHYDEAGNAAEKYLMWAHFYLSYMKMIAYDDYSEEDTALSYMEQLHDSFFNDYRKTLFGMATYFYYRRDVKKGDCLLLSDCYVLRQRRPRLQGFFHLTNAVRAVVTDDEQSALAELEKASEIFSAIPSYSKLIHHNISILKWGGSALGNPRPLRYYWGDTMDDGVYYLDIRGCW